MNTLYIVILAIIVLLAIVIIVRKKKSSQHADSSDGESAQLYVGNLSYSLKDHQLKEVFSVYGEISSVHIIKHPQSRRSKGFGFITFDSLKSTKKALKMHGKELNGRTLVVRIANPRE